MRKTTLAVALLLFSLLALDSRAAIVAVVDSGTFNVGLQLTPDLSTILATDFRASAALGVVDTTGPSILSLVLATDDGAPFPNSTVFLLNSTLTELGALTFSPGTGVISGTTYTVDALFAPAGVLTDPGLLALVGGLTATFDLIDAVALGDSVVAIYGLSGLLAEERPGSPIPEPGTWLLSGIGMAGVLAIRRKHAS